MVRPSYDIVRGHTTNARLSASRQTIVVKSYDLVRRSYDVIMNQACNLSMADDGCSNATDVPYANPYSISNWGWTIKQVCTPVIVLVGIVGNCLSFIVMKSKLLRHRSYSHYLCALAVFDSLTLLGQELEVVDAFLRDIKKTGLFLHFNASGCKIFTFAESVCYLMSSWLVVCMALERVLVVYTPFRKHTICTQRGAVAVILALFVFAAYTQLFRLIMVTKVRDRCESASYFTEDFLRLHIYFYQLCLAFAFPILCVFVCNVMVLWKIKKVGKAAAGENSTSTRLARGAAKRHKTTMMLLTICFTYILTLFPTVLLTILIIVVIRVSDGLTARDFLIQVSPWKDLFIVITAINYAANFFIYVLSGKHFRLQLRHMFYRERSSLVNNTKTREEITLM
ncbi:melanin-concentrating hormone receptor 2-like [Gigantopelta aegis]|uniref:melanin-concentrating hormone receptor 2-like n=1 Tax=Gigantopelta aegis TaxID=1735272 RepID=UPI001B88D899|nr:melanin-concentrating hormone receptor 2-like [Gigantopelta aegis]